MTVNPGFGGQKFIPGMLKKIREAKHLVESLSAETSIEVDGGITIRNIGAVSEAGADIFVGGGLGVHERGLRGNDRHDERHP